MPSIFSINWLVLIYKKRTISKLRTNVDGVLVGKEVGVAEGVAVGALVVMIGVAVGFIIGVAVGDVRSNPFLFSNEKRLEEPLCCSKHAS